MKNNSLIFNSFLAFSIILGTFLFNSCSKEDSIKGLKNNTVLSFKNMNEYMDAGSKVLSFNYKELKAWEESKGFKSFGRTCDELYYSIKPESFNSKEDIIAFVALNSEYLQLIEEENGELTLETQLYNSTDRYFINKDKIFQINKNVYKVFDFGIISTKVDNIEKLKQINENNYSFYENDSDFRFTNKSSETIPLKDAVYNCGTGDVKRSTNGRDRTKLTIDVDIKHGEKPFPGAIELSYKTHFIIRPYKRIAGIWYWARRHISADINLATDAYVENNSADDVIGGAKANVPNSKWIRKFYNYYNNGTLDWKLEGTWNYIKTTNILFMPYIHFGGYDCWADTPSTPPAELECNTSLF